MRTQIKKRDSRQFAPVVVSFMLLVLSPGAAKGESNISSIYQRSYDLEATGKASEALERLKKMDRRERGSYTYILRLAWLQHLTGKYGAAIKTYNRAIALKPRALEPWLGLLLPQIASRRWKDAEKSARKVLRLDPRSFLGNSRLAWIRYNRGLYAESARLYERVLGSYPSSVEMQTGLAWALLKQGKKARAEEIFSAVLRVSPRNALARSGMNAMK